MDVGFLRQAVAPCKHEQNTFMENVQDYGLRMLQSRAEEIEKDAAELGQEAALELLDQLEAHMLKLVELQDEVRAHSSALDELPDHAEELKSPKALQEELDAQVKKHTTKLRTARARGGGGEELRALRALRTRVVGGDDEAPPEGLLNTDELQMTEERITNFNCPISMKPMEIDGDNRPVTAPGHGPRCVFTHAGITQFLKGKKGKTPCPIPGCGLILLEKELKPAAKMLKLLRENAEATEQEEANAEGMYVD